MRILLIEDDAMIGRGLVRGLEDHGMAVDWVRTGTNGHATLMSDKDEYALVLLDIGLPDMTGFAQYDPLFDGAPLCDGVSITNRLSCGA